MAQSVQGPMFNFAYACDLLGNLMSKTYQINI